MGKPHMDKRKEITDDWNYDSSCAFTLLPVSGFDNFKQGFLLHRVYMFALLMLEICA
jgi:hypothetical protein